MSNFGIVSVPDEVWELTHITDLLLDGNQLTSISPKIGNLINLETLWLNNNQLLSLPDSINKLVKLEITDIQDNCLTNEPNINLPNTDVYTDFSTILKGEKVTR